MLVQTRMNPNRKTRLWFAKHSTILHSIQQETSEVAHPSDETVENGSFSSPNVYSFSPFNRDRRLQDSSSKHGHWPSFSAGWTVTTNKMIRFYCDLLYIFCCVPSLLELVKTCIWISSCLLYLFLPFWCRITRRLSQHFGEMTWITSRFYRLVTWWTLLLPSERIELSASG